MTNCPTCNGTGSISPKKATPPAHSCEMRVQLAGHHGEMDNCGEPATWFYDKKWYCQRHAGTEDTRMQERKKMITQELKDIRAWEKARQKKK